MNATLIKQSKDAFITWEFSSRLVRKKLLEDWSRELVRESSDLSQLITDEVSKPITLARAEVQRSILLIESTLEAYAGFNAEDVVVDLLPGGSEARGSLKFFPLGPVLLITPFNFPVNLAVHKLAPALAAGNSVLWKPCPQAPRTSQLLLSTLHRALLKSHLSTDLVQVLSSDPEEVESIALHPEIKAVSFTGSERVGQHLQKILWNKKITLELGGNAAVVLDQDIDLRAVAMQLAISANSYAGQSCCSAQRIYIHEKIYNDFSKIFLEEITKLPVGDPNLPETVIGPVIDEDSAKRIEAWISGAVRTGAKCLLGGPRVGSFIPPHVLVDVPPSSEICSEEVFGPVVLLQSVSSFEEGLRQAQTTRYGLRSSAYTNAVSGLFLAEKILRAGGVMINLPPTYRVDSAPFGGVGASGVGIEGPRWALEFFSEKRLIAFAPPPKS